MDYFWSPNAVRGCLGCLMKVLSDATNSFIYLHYNSMELGPLRAGGGAKRPLLRVSSKNSFRVLSKVTCIVEIHMNACPAYVSTSDHAWLF